MNRFVCGIITTIMIPAVVIANVIRIDESNFSADAGLITFSEFPLGTQNPVYTPDLYGADPTGVTVSFGGYFLGQAVGGIIPGANPDGVVTGTPVSELSLDPNAPNTFITDDGANPTTPVLSGNPIFNGPISMLFNQDIAGVGLDGGYFNAIGGTAITAFNRQGEVLGQVFNTGLGIEFLGLVTDDNTNQIAGLQFSLVGPEPAGYAIDNLRFGFAGQIIPPDNVPEPSILILLGLGIMSCGFLGLKKNNQYN